MGEAFEFKCPQCGYRAEVCGKSDWGMTVELTTYSCADCRKLRDLVTARGVYGEGLPKRRVPPLFPGENAPDYALAGGRTLPACGSPMGEGEISSIWD